MTHPAIHHAGSVPPADPLLEAARKYRLTLLRRPMLLDPQVGPVPDLTPDEWGWLKSYRAADARLRRSSR